MGFLNKTKLIFGVLILLVVAVPITVYVVQRQQESRGRANASTTLSLIPVSPVNPVVGDNISFDVKLSPGSNLASFVKLQVLYDPTVLELSTTNPFERNIDAFPIKVEGPVMTSGSIIESISIGNDPTKVVNAPTIIGRLNFKAISTTGDTPSTITFGSNNLVLSLAEPDQSTENVLSTTSPASVIIANPTSPTPTPQVSPTSIPTDIPTPSLTPVPTASSTPTPTPILSLTPTLTSAPTPTPLPSTLLNINVILHGIGIGGDNANPTANTLSNKNPMHPVRTASVSFYNSNHQVVATSSGNIQYSSSSGSFAGVINAGYIPPAIYTLKIQTNGYLIRRVQQIISIIGGQTLNIPLVTLTTGDINNDNQLNILDYNLLFDCYTDYGTQPTTCTANKKAATDTNDDNLVNGVDYNLFLREIATQAGD